jgi:hypothetical protein
MPLPPSGGILLGLTRHPEAARGHDVMPCPNRRGLSPRNHTEAAEPYTGDSLRRGRERQISRSEKGSPGVKSRRPKETRNGPERPGGRRRVRTGVLDGFGVFTDVAETAWLRAWTNHCLCPKTTGTRLRLGRDLSGSGPSWCFQGRVEAEIFDH